MQGTGRQERFPSFSPYLFAGLLVALAAGWALIYFLETYWVVGWLPGWLAGWLVTSRPATLQFQQVADSSIAGCLAGQLIGQAAGWLESFLALVSLGQTCPCALCH